MGTDPRNVSFLRSVGPHGFSELIGELGHDLEARVAIENLDGADLGLGHVAGAADERQQPARIRIALAADVQAEPHHVAVLLPWSAWRSMVALRGPCRPIGRHIAVLAPGAFATTVGTIVAPGGLDGISQIFRRRQLSAVHAHQRQRDLVCGTPGLQHTRQRQIFLGLEPP